MQPDILIHMSDGSDFGNLVMKQPADINALVGIAPSTFAIKLMSV
jgi:hypothetical protein